MRLDHLKSPESRWRLISTLRSSAAQRNYGVKTITAEAAEERGDAEISKVGPLTKIGRHLLLRRSNAVSLRIPWHRPSRELIFSHHQNWSPTSLCGPV